MISGIGYNAFILLPENAMPERTSSNPLIATWLSHIHALAVDIGPRGPTRDGERQAAHYAYEQFAKIGLQPKWETFSSARSIFHPHLLGSSLMLLAFFLFPLATKGTAIVAAVLSIFVLANELLELSFINNIFRIVTPKGQSQNVWAVIPSAGAHQRDLLLVGHLDSQRTSIIFSTQRWVSIYDYFTMVTFACFILQAIIYSLAIFLQISWAWYASIPAALCAFLLAVMCLQAEATPFTAGANDNASAVGMVLSLAKELETRPLEHTRVFAVCTGCEEVQHYGMIDFYKRHLAELVSPVALVFEMIGCSGPAWLTREGIIVPFTADANLVRMAENLAREHPEWGAYPAVTSGGNTEMADALRCKIPAITLTGMTKEGVSPYWHQLADTFDKMRPDVMEKTWQMTWAMIKKLDGQKD